MEYQVPQFIEVEDKIFGPLTLKQFIYLAGGAGLCVVFFLYLPLLIAIVLSVPVASFAGALAFYKINNKNFIDILEAGFNYYIGGGNLYLWRKDRSENAATTEAAPAAPAPEVRAKLGLSSSKLRDLAWSLDIKDRENPPA